METEETGKERDKPKAISGKGRGYISLVFGLLTWSVIALLTIDHILHLHSNLIGALSKLWPLFCVIFSVLGIAIGSHALKTNEWFVAIIGMALCFGFYAFFIVLLCFTD